MSIIFEDDCVPHSDFLECTILVNKYVKNPTMSYIGGCNYIKDKGINPAKVIKTNIEWR